MNETERLAELLSWATGEFTRYSPKHSADHNRWSWRGDGHGSVLRDDFRLAADTILDSDWLAEHDDRIRREERAYTLLQVTLKLDDLAEADS